MLSAITHHFLANDGLSTPGAMALWLFVVFFVIGIICLIIGLFIFWVVMIVDAHTRKNWTTPEQRTIWLIVLWASLFFQFFWAVALIYYFAIKKPLDKGEEISLYEHRATTSPSPTPAGEEDPTKPKKRTQRKKKP